MLRSHVHGYIICVYERLIILMFLCQFMMLHTADCDLAQPVRLLHVLVTELLHVLVGSFYAKYALSALTVAASVRRADGAEKPRAMARSSISETGAEQEA